MKPHTRSFLHALAAACALLLAACASSPSSSGGVLGPPMQGTPPAPGTPGTPVPPRGPAIPSSTPLATEQRFLEEWFRGTPVQISAQPPSQLQVSVPLMHSFDAGRSDIKPALNAVLDRVAESLRRHAGARISVVAPSDANGPATLSQARAQRVRDSLGTKGVAGTRVTLADVPPGGGPLLLQLAMPTASSQPVARRGDAGGVKPVSTAKPASPGWTEKKQP
jgi:outer membrane protein OmpA-like peptidoglycan-associated protein